VLVEDNRWWLYTGVSRPIADLCDYRLDGFVFRLKVDSAVLTAGSYKMAHGRSCPQNLSKYVTGEREPEDLFSLHTSAPYDDRGLISS
jgi:hypothetical protein